MTELFHKLARLAKLDLKDDGHVAIALEGFEVEPGEASEAFAWIVDGLQLSARRAKESCSLRSRILTSEGRVYS